MKSRIIKTLWRLFAQIEGGINSLIPRNLFGVYCKLTEGLLNLLQTSWVSASLEKANATYEICRTSPRYNSFISPLLGPYHFMVRALFFCQNDTDFMPCALVCATQSMNGDLHV
ncbi:MAG: hypothetical protein COB84_06000 [Rhodobacteraceae bacterium]|nr:MAG: hypothetical protein COB84_06000 [Paracoccaceae bacterium]